MTKEKLKNFLIRFLILSTLKLVKFLILFANYEILTFNKKKKNNKILFEIGANLGTDTIGFLKKGYEVYAFEPTPELCVVLQNKFSHFKNFHLINMAVDVKNSFRTFNIASHDDWGVSSLYKFSKEIKNWKNRKDFYFDNSIKTQTIRLDTFMNIYKLCKKINYLHIDTQGNDLAVLKSLGKNIRFVEKGQCEASNNIKLYKNTDNTKNKIVNFLKKKKFIVAKIAYDSNGAECNIFFKRFSNNRTKYK
jgi:FkbM family methyltransferase